MKFIRVKCCKHDICPEEGGVGYFCWPGVRLVFTAPPGGAVGWYCRSPVFGNKWNLEALLMKTPLNPRNDGLESDKQVKRIKTALAHRVLWQSRTQTHTHIQPKKKKVYLLCTIYHKQEAAHTAGLSSVGVTLTVRSVNVLVLVSREVKERWQRLQFWCN